MAASLASSRTARTSHTGSFLHEDDHYRNNPCSTNRLPDSSFKVTPYGHEATRPYGRYQRRVNHGGPLATDAKQEIRALKDHSKSVAKDDNYSSSSDSDGDLDENPRRHKVKKEGVPCQV